MEEGRPWQEEVDEDNEHDAVLLKRWVATPRGSLGQYG